MTPSILLVDDDAALLSGIQRQLRKQFELTTALSGAEGLEAIGSHGPFSVVVSDMQMPNMNGVEFLSRVRSVSPQSTRIMLTGNADQRTAIEAVNKGQIFRFLNKPCSPEDLSSTLTAGIEQYRLVTAEAELVQKTLMGSVNMVMGALSSADPKAFGMATRAKLLAKEIGAALNVEQIWQLELAALLAKIGLVSVPAAIRAKADAGETLTPSDKAALDRVPENGYELLRKIPRLEAVAHIVHYHEKRFDGSGPPNTTVKGEGIPIESRIIKALYDYVALEETSAQRQGAIRLLWAHAEWYDPNILNTIAAIVLSSARTDANQETKEPVETPEQAAVRRAIERAKADRIAGDRSKTERGSITKGVPVGICGLRIGDRLVNGIWGADGVQLLPANIKITADVFERIDRLSATAKIVQPVYITRD